MASRSALERLNQIPADTGRAITESGGVVNNADLDRGSQSLNESAQVNLGRVHQTYKRYTLAVGETAYFFQGIPAGTVTRGISASLEVLNGDVEMAFQINGTTSGLVEELPAFNADRRRVNLSDPSESTSFSQYTNMTGQVVVGESLVYASVPGTSKNGTALTNANIGGIFDSTTQPSFKYTNVGADACEIIVTYIWADITDIVDHVIDA